MCEEETEVEWIRGGDGQCWRREMRMLEVEVDEEYRWRSTGGWVMTRNRGTYTEFSICKFFT